MMSLSGAAHALTLAGVLVLTGLGHATPTPQHTAAREPATDLMRLVYLADPGPGGGGGGGGRRETLAAPKSLREGTHPMSSPLPATQSPAAEATPPPVPTPLDSPPSLAVPIVASPSDARDRNGVLEHASSEADSHGQGAGGGAGSGTGTGLGGGSGSGVGAGSGGGTGGGPFRPGSGIAPPRLLHEIKPTYPDSARRSGITGEVDMEIVVRRDGTVGEIRLLKGLSAELNDHAVDAVQQWRFAPATRLGVPVDVIVEVSVEFKLR